MTFRLLATLVLLTSLVPASGAQQLADEARLGACHTAGPAGIGIGINLDDASGPIYFLQVSFDEFATLPMLIGPLPLDAEGFGVLGGSLGNMPLPPSFGIQFRALFLEGTFVKKTNIAEVIINPEGCEPLDIDFGYDAAVLQAGEIAAEQWSPVGMHISATSQLVSGTHTAIVYDSGNPTGADDDLKTPGTGIGNDTALGKLLVIAENLVDDDNDGIVDEPDDAFNGGLIHFDFDEPKTICSGTVVDVDDEGVTRFRFYSDNAGTNLITSVIIPNLGDNSVQTVFFHVEGVRRLDFKAGGSAGLAAISACPTCVDFDHTTWGLPLDLAVGETVDTQFLATLGLTISADNAYPGHPDKAIVFDTANPTGNDDDLLTPGPGIGNTVARGKVLIIPGDDVDGNLDGLVDVPDDEAFGGSFMFAWEYDVEIKHVTLLDVDGLEVGFVRCFDVADNVLETLPLAILGNNSSQTIEMNAGGVRRLEVHLGGSGALAELCFCPDP